MTTNRSVVVGWILLLAFSAWLLPSPARADDSRASQQLAVDINGSLATTHGQSLRLADLPVLALKDRTVWLRLTLRGAPPQAFPNPVMKNPGITPTTRPIVTVDVTRFITHRH